MSVQGKKILVVGPSWVGDMVMAQSLFMQLKQAQPECVIDVLAPDWSFPLLERMPQVNQPISLPFKHGQFAFSARKQLGLKLKQKGYERAIVLPNSWKSALVPFFAQIPIRSGYLGEMRVGLLNDWRKLDKHKLSMTVQRFINLAAEKNDTQSLKYTTPKLHIDASQQKSVAEKFNINRQQKTLVLCPGAEYGPAKCWPAEHFARVAKQKQAQAWNVILMGSGKDQTIAQKINRLSDASCLDLSGKTSLAEAVDVMSLADVVVSNDSGLMHVAAALNKELIAIYGSSDPGFTPPLNAQAKIIDLQLACSPCFKRVCPLGHTRCLTEITPEYILARIEQ